MEQNPLCSSPELSSEDPLPDHCCPLSPDGDRMDPSPTVPEASTGEETNGDMTKQTATFPEGGDEQVEVEPQYTSESQDQDHDVPSTGQMSFKLFLVCR